MEDGFVIRVAADIYGKKYNREYIFPVAPLIAELINVVEAQYDAIGRANRPPGFPDIPFQAQTFQWFDELQCTWIDLYSAQQITSGVQLFCFQPESRWHSEVQQGIPDTPRVITWVSADGSGRRRDGSDSGIPPSYSEKLRSTFAELDTGNKGSLIYNDLANGLMRCTMQLISTTPEELFMSADVDEDGHISFEEWVTFAITPSNLDLINSIYFRFKDNWNHRRVGASDQLADLAIRDITRRGQEISREVAWAQHRHQAQGRYEEAKLEASLMRQVASEASDREQNTYEMIYGASPTSFNDSLVK